MSTRGHRRERGGHASAVIGMYSNPHEWHPDLPNLTPLLAPVPLPCGNVRHRWDGGAMAACGAKRSHNLSVWKWTKPFVVTGAIMLVCLLAFRMLPYHIRAQTMFDGPWNELEFDAEVWRAREVYDMGRGVEDRGQMSSLKRGMMLQDLCNNHLRKGMHKEEIRRLLGTPENQGNGPGFGHDGLPANQWTYDLGSWSGFRMDGDFLTIVFDNENQLDFFISWQG